MNNNDKLKQIENVLQNTKYNIDDYLEVINKLQDERSKEILFNRVMLDNTNNPYYGLMLQKSAIKEDAFNNEMDRMMYQQVNFLLKNENYKKKIYCIGFSNNNYIPKCIVWNSWEPLNVVCIFDYIHKEDEYTYDATGGKYIDVVSLDRINEYDFSDSIVIIANRRYIYIRDELIKNNKIDLKDTFTFYTDACNERNEQYFGESFLDMSENEVLIDGGAFNLYTAYSFNKYVYGMYEKIYSFEPVYEQYLDCKKNLESYPIPNVEIYNLGLSDCKKELKFENAGSASRENKNGNIIVKVDSLDNILDGKRASIIKLDIEGAEYDAIVGAEKTIKKYKPTLMICAYHKPNDILELTKLILSYNKDYKIYVRHYSYTIYETVLYFINK